MKNKYWRFTAKFLAISVASILLAVAVIGVLAYAAYKIFDSASLRGYVLSIVNMVGVVFRNIPMYFLIPVVLILALAFCVLFSKQTTSRLSAIVEAVSQVRENEYRVLLPNNNSDLLGELEWSINQMAKQMEDTLKEHKQMEQSKDDFIVNIAHDLRTPLTSIIGYLAFISEKQLDPEISVKYAAIAYGKSKQLENLVENLFDIARFTAADMVITKGEINLKKFLLQKQDEMYPQLHDADMEMRMDISQKVSSIFADGDLMARVFDNLIGNAIRYARAGKFIDIHAVSREHDVLISFVTHSDPVPEAELERIFDKLYRIEKSRAEQTGGTGMGLSISRRIVELHGGTLTARQTEDGTAFDIALPK